MAKYRPTPLGVYVEALLFKEKMTQKDLAEKIGVSPSEVCGVVNGKRNAHRKFVAMACARWPEYFEPEFIKTLEYNSRKKVLFKTGTMKPERREKIIEIVKDVIE